MVDNNINTKVSNRVEYENSYSLRVDNHSFWLSCKLLFLSFILVAPLLFIYFNMLFLTDVFYISLAVVVIAFYLILILKKKFYLDLLVKENKISKTTAKHALYYLINNYIIGAIAVYVIGWLVL